MSERLPAPELANQLGWEGSVKSCRKIPPGFSGARVYQVELSGGQKFALKRLADSATAERVQTIHHAAREIRSLGGAMLPEFSNSVDGVKRSCLIAAGSLWECCRWIAGKPLGLTAAEDGIIAGAAAIGRLHWASAQFYCTVGIGPAISERIDRLEILTTQDACGATADSHVERFCKWNAVSMTSREAMSSAFSEGCGLLVNGWPDVKTELIRELQLWSGRSLPLFYVPRDIHREHMLFAAPSFPEPIGPEPPDLAASTETSLAASTETEPGQCDQQISNGQPVGIIDLDAFRVDTPMIDLARWLGSFDTADVDSDPIVVEPASMADDRGAGLNPGIDRAVWEKAVAAYWDECPLKQHRVAHRWPILHAPDRPFTASDCFELAILLHRSTVWGSLGNWVQWIMAGRAFPCGPERIARRLERLVRLAKRDFQSRR